MELSYFDVTVPVFIKSLNNLKAILKKGEAHAKEIGMSESDFLDQKLAEDMFPLLRQIQVVTDTAKGAVARLAGVDQMQIEDAETTCAELYKRIDTVTEHIETFRKEAFSGAGDRHIVLPYYEGKHFLGRDYLVEFAFPNFFFHLNMAYALMRKQGTTIGKQDYLGSLSLQEGE